MSSLSEIVLNAKYLITVASDNFSIYFFPFTHVNFELPEE